MGHTSLNTYGWLIIATILYGWHLNCDALKEENELSTSAPLTKNEHLIHNSASTAKTSKLEEVSVGVSRDHIIDGFETTTIASGQSNSIRHDSMTTSKEMSSSTSENTSKNEVAKTDKLFTSSPKTGTTLRNRSESGNASSSKATATHDAESTTRGTMVSTSVTADSLRNLSTTRKNSQNAAENAATTKDSLLTSAKPKEVLDISKNSESHTSSSTNGEILATFTTSMEDSGINAKTEEHQMTTTVFRKSLDNSTPRAPSQSTTTTSDEIVTTSATIANTINNSAIPQKHSDAPTSIQGPGGNTATNGTRFDSSTTSGKFFGNSAPIRNDNNSGTFTSISGNGTSVLITNSDFKISSTGIPHEKLGSNTKKMEMATTIRHNMEPSATTDKTVISSESSSKNTNHSTSNPTIIKTTTTKSIEISAPVTEKIVYNVIDSSTTGKEAQTISNDNIFVTHPTTTKRSSVVPTTSQIHGSTTMEQENRSLFPSSSKDNDSASRIINGTTATVSITERTIDSNSSTLTMINRNDSRAAAITTEYDLEKHETTKANPGISATTNKSKPIAATTPGTDAVKAESKSEISETLEQGNSKTYTTPTSSSSGTKAETNEMNAETTQSKSGISVTTARASTRSLASTATTNSGTKQTTAKMNSKTFPIITESNFMVSETMTTSSSRNSVTTARKNTEPETITTGVNSETSQSTTIKSPVTTSKSPTITPIHNSGMTTLHNSETSTAGKHSSEKSTTIAPSNSETTTTITTNTSKTATITTGINTGTSAMPNSINSETSTMPNSINSGNSAKPTEINSGPSAKPTEINSGTSAIPTGINSGTSAIPTIINSGTSAMPTGINSGTSAISTRINSGTSAKPTETNSGTSAMPNGINSGTSVKPTGINSGTSAMPTEINSGTSAMPTEINSGTSAMPTEINSGTSAIPNRINYGTSAMPKGLNSGTSAIPKGLNSGTSAIPTGINSGTSAIPTRINSGTSAMPTGINSGTSAMPTGINSGTSAKPTETNSGTSAMPNGINSGTSAMPTEINSGTSAIQNRINYGTSAMPKGLNSGTSAIPKGLNSGTSAMPKGLNSGTSAIPKGLNSGTSAIPIGINSESLATKPQNNIEYSTTTVTSNAETTKIKNESNSVTDATGSSSLIHETVTKSSIKTSATTAPSNSGTSAKSTNGVSLTTNESNTERASLTSGSNNIISATTAKIGSETSVAPHDVTTRKLTGSHDSTTMTNSNLETSTTTRNSISTKSILGTSIIASNTARPTPTTENAARNMTTFSGTSSEITVKATTAKLMSIPYTSTSYGSPSGSTTNNPLQQLQTTMASYESKNPPKTNASVMTTPTTVTSITNESYTATAATGSSNLNAPSVLSTVASPTSQNTSGRNEVANTTEQNASLPLPTTVTTSERENTTNDSTTQINKLEMITCSQGEVFCLQMWRCVPILHAMSNTVEKWQSRKACKSSEVFCEKTGTCHTMYGYDGKWEIHNCARDEVFDLQKGTCAKYGRSKNDENNVYEFPYTTPNPILSKLSKPNNKMCPSGEIYPLPVDIVCRQDSDCPLQSKCCHMSLMTTNKPHCVWIADFNQCPSFMHYCSLTSNCHLPSRPCGTVCPSTWEYCDDKQRCVRNGSCTNATTEASDSLFPLPEIPLPVLNVTPLRPVLEDEEIEFETSQVFTFIGEGDVTLNIKENLLLQFLEDYLQHNQSAKKFRQWMNNFSALLSVKSMQLEISETGCTEISKDTQNNLFPCGNGVVIQVANSDNTTSKTWSSHCIGAGILVRRSQLIRLKLQPNFYGNITFNVSPVIVDIDGRQLRGNQTNDANIVTVLPTNDAPIIRREAKYVDTEVPFVTALPSTGINSQNGFIDGGTSVEDIVSAFYSDPDGGEPLGMALLSAQVSSLGNWQYKMPNSDWVDVNDMDSSMSILKKFGVADNVQGMMPVDKRLQNHEQATNDLESKVRVPRSIEFDVPETNNRSQYEDNIQYSNETSEQSIAYSKDFQNVVEPSLRNNFIIRNNNQSLATNRTTYNLRKKFGREKQSKCSSAINLLNDFLEAITTAATIITEATTSRYTSQSISMLPITTESDSQSDFPDIRVTGSQVGSSTANDKVDITAKETSSTTRQQTTFVASNTPRTILTSESYSTPKNKAELLESTDEPLVSIPIRTPVGTNAPVSPAVTSTASNATSVTTESELPPTATEKLHSQSTRLPMSSKNQETTSKTSTEQPRSSLASSNSSLTTTGSELLVTATTEKQQSQSIQTPMFLTNEETTSKTSSEQPKISLTSSTVAVLPTASISKLASNQPIQSGSATEFTSTSRVTIDEKENVTPQTLYSSRSTTTEANNANTIEAITTRSYSNSPAARTDEHSSSIQLGTTTATTTSQSESITKRDMERSTISTTLQDITHSEANVTKSFSSNSPETDTELPIQLGTSKTTFATSQSGTFLEDNSTPVSIKKATGTGILPSETSTSQTGTGTTPTELLPELETSTKRAPTSRSDVTIEIMSTSAFSSGTGTSETGITTSNPSVSTEHKSTMSSEGKVNGTFGSGMLTTLMQTTSQPTKITTETTRRPTTTRSTYPMEPYFYETEERQEPEVIPHEATVLFLPPTARLRFMPHQQDRKWWTLPDAMMSSKLVFAAWDGSDNETAGGVRNVSLQLCSKHNTHCANNGSLSGQLTVMHRGPADCTGQIPLQRPMQIDDCLICGGNGKLCRDCNGKINGDAILDCNECSEYEVRDCGLQCHDVNTLKTEPYNSKDVCIIKFVSPGENHCTKCPCIISTNSRGYTTGCSTASNRLNIDTQNRCGVCSTNGTETPDNDEAHFCGRCSNEPNANYLKKQYRYFDCNNKWKRNVLIDAIAFGAQPHLNWHQIAGSAQTVHIGLKAFYKTQVQLHVYGPTWSYKQDVFKNVFCTVESIDTREVLNVKSTLEEDRMMFSFDSKNLQKGDYSAQCKLQLNDDSFYAVSPFGKLSVVDSQDMKVNSIMPGGIEINSNETHVITLLGSGFVNSIDLWCFYKLRPFREAKLLSKAEFVNVNTVRCNVRSDQFNDSHILDVGVVVSSAAIITHNREPGVTFSTATLDVFDTPPAIVSAEILLNENLINVTFDRNIRTSSCSYIFNKMNLSDISGLSCEAQTNQMQISATKEKLEDIQQMSDELRNFNGITSTYGPQYNNDAKGNVIFTKRQGCVSSAQKRAIKFKLIGPNQVCSGQITYKVIASASSATYSRRFYWTVKAQNLDNQSESFKKQLQRLQEIANNVNSLQMEFTFSTQMLTPNITYEVVARVDCTSETSSVTVTILSQKLIYLPLAPFTLTLKGPLKVDPRREIRLEAITEMCPSSQRTEKPNFKFYWEINTDEASLAEIRGQFATIEKGSLQGRKEYVVTCIAIANGDVSTGTMEQFNFTTITADPIVVVTPTKISVPTNQGFLLDAQQSFDPQEKWAPLRFYWKCRTLDGNGCYSENNTAIVRLETLYYNEMQFPLVSISENILNVNTYIFTVHVVALDGRKASASVDVQITNSLRAPKIRIIQGSENRVVPNSDVTLRALVSASAGTTLTWQGTNDVGYSMFDTSSTFSPGWYRYLHSDVTNLPVSVILKPSTLTEDKNALWRHLDPNSKYNIRLTASHPLDGITYAEIRLKTQKASNVHMQKFKVSPSSGIALLTPFVVDLSQTLNYFDEQVSLFLSYKTAGQDTNRILRQITNSEFVIRGLRLPAIANTTEKLTVTLKACKSESICSTIESEPIEIRPPTIISKNYYELMLSAVSVLNDKGDLEAALQQSISTLQTLQFCGLNFNSSSMYRKFDNIANEMIQLLAATAETRLLWSSSSYDQAIDILSALANASDNVNPTRSTMMALLSLHNKIMDSIARPLSTENRAHLGYDLSSDYLKNGSLESTKFEAHSRVKRKSSGGRSGGSHSSSSGSKSGSKSSSNTKQSSHNTQSNSNSNTNSNPNSNSNSNSNNDKTSSSNAATMQRPRNVAGASNPVNSERIPAHSQESVSKSKFDPGYKSTVIKERKRSTTTYQSNSYSSNKRTTLLGTNTRPKIFMRPSRRRYRGVRGWRTNNNKETSNRNLNDILNSNNSNNFENETNNETMDILDLYEPLTANQVQILLHTTNTIVKQNESYSGVLDEQLLNDLSYIWGGMCTRTENSGVKQTAKSEFVTVIVTKADVNDVLRKEQQKIFKSMHHKFGNHFEFQYMIDLEDRPVQLECDGTQSNCGVVCSGSAQFLSDPFTSASLLITESMEKNRRGDILVTWGALYGNTVAVDLFEFVQQLHLDISISHTLVTKKEMPFLKCAALDETAWRTDICQTTKVTCYPSEVKVTCTCPPTGYYGVFLDAELTPIKPNIEETVNSTTLVTYPTFISNQNVKSPFVTKHLYDVSFTLNGDYERSVLTVGVHEFGEHIKNQLARMFNVTVDYFPKIFISKGSIKVDVRVTPDPQGNYGGDDQLIQSMEQMAAKDKLCFTDFAGENLCTRNETFHVDYIDGKQKEPLPTTADPREMTTMKPFQPIHSYEIFFVLNGDYDNSVTKVGKENFIVHATNKLGELLDVPASYFRQFDVQKGSIEVTTMISPDPNNRKYGGGKNLVDKIQQMIAAGTLCFQGMNNEQLCAKKNSYAMKWNDDDAAKETHSVIGTIVGIVFAIVAVLVLLCLVRAIRKAKQRNNKIKAMNESMQVPPAYKEIHHEAAMLEGTIMEGTIDSRDQYRMKIEGGGGERLFESHKNKQQPLLASNLEAMLPNMTPEHTGKQPNTTVQPAPPQMQ